MKRIYIAHPLVGDGSKLWGDQARNVERYLRFAADATNAGHVVLSWVHHYLLHSRMLTDGDADFYLDRDCVLIGVADELWIAGPPELSRGMRREIAHAEALGIPVRRMKGWQRSQYWAKDGESLPPECDP